MGKKAPGGDSTVKNFSGVTSPEESKMVVQEQSAPCIDSVTPAFNFVQKYPRTRSTARIELAEITESIASVLSTGREVSELDILNWYTPVPPEHPRRYLKGDCMRALRVIHRCYPRHTKLYLKDGVYVLTPIAPEVCK